MTYYVTFIFFDQQTEALGKFSVIMCAVLLKCENLLPVCLFCSFCLSVQDTVNISCERSA